MQNRKIEVFVGLFMLIVLCSVIFICFKAVDLSSLQKNKTFTLYANITNVGGLKVRSPVKIGGVIVGRVDKIELIEDRSPDFVDGQGNKIKGGINGYIPRITLSIDDRFNFIPSTSSLAIRTSGLLGEQFLALTIGFYDENDDTGFGGHLLKDGDTITETVPAMMLEDIIGQVLYGKDSSTVESDNDSKDLASEPQSNK